MHSINPSAAPQPSPSVLFTRLPPPSPLSPLTPIPSPSTLSPSRSSSFFSSRTLLASLYTILSVKNYYILTRLLIWLLTHVTNSGFLQVAVGLIRVFDEAFVSTEMLDELLPLLAAHSSPSSTSSTSNACSCLLADIITKYHESLVCKKWCEENPTHPAAQPATKQSQNTSSPSYPFVQQFAHTRTQTYSSVVPNGSGHVHYPTESITHFGNTEKLITIIGNFIEEKGASNDELERSEESESYQSAKSLFLIEPSPSKLGAALKNSLSTYILH